MKLVGLELLRVEIPFRVEIGTAVGVHRTRSLLFVRVETTEGEGWGECAALAQGTSVDPTVDEVERAMVERGVTRLVDASRSRDGELPAARHIAQLFGSSSVDRMMGAAFEMAVIDAELRLTGQSLAEALGVTSPNRTMPVGAAVGIPANGDIEALRVQVDIEVAMGTKRVRMKIAPGWDIAPVRAVRADHEALTLQVDANGSYRLDTADPDDPTNANHLAALADYEVAHIEQPLPPADLIAHAELSHRLPLPICLDESLTTPRRVADALRNGSCQVACLKPGRLGGMWATRQAHAACAEAGVPTFIGGFFEAGLGRSANLALAALLAQTSAELVGDLSDPSEYLELDPCGYPVVAHGSVTVPSEPGVGRAPDLGQLDRLGAQRRWFPATYT